ncbi:MAG: CarD family transcriptional regulator, partial [Flavobacteriales bacterium]
MYISELKELYAKHPKVAVLNQACTPTGAKLHLRNTIGSSFSLIAESVCQHHGGFHLLVLPDKEEAAYVLNDLQSITGNSGEDKNPNFKLCFFPRSAKSAYEIEQTDNANVAQRAEILNELKPYIHAPSSTSAYCVITYPEAIAEKIITESTLNAVTFELHTDQKLDLEFVDEWMHTYGFEKVDYVYEPGQYAVRGGIIDIFSFSFEYPYRIELFGDVVDSIRKFDPQTQLSVAMMTRATIVPNITTQTSEESRVTLLDFMPKETLVWIKDVVGCAEKCQEELEKAERLFEKLGTTIQRAKPDELFVSKYELLRTFESRTVIEFGPQRKFAEGQVIAFEMEPQPAFRKNFEMLYQNLHAFQKQGYSNTISAGQPKQIERLFQIFEDKKFEPCFTPITLEFSEGFIDRDLKLLVYTDHQIFERYHRFKLKEGFKKNKEALTIKEIMSLQPGDYVVHIDHGIGQFSGLQKIDVNGKEQEAIRLTYKGGDILYVSIHSLHRISKFTGKEGTAPSVDKLGSNAWQAVKRKTKAKVKEIAFDLIRLYAKRKATKGHAFQSDSYLQNELEASFMYEDTPDQ